MKKEYYEYLPSPCIVLCNYLDGAVADYENGNTEAFDFIMECIVALRLLGDPDWYKYQDRMLKTLGEKPKNVYFDEFTIKEE